MFHIYNIMEQSIYTLFHWLHHRLYMYEHNVCSVISEPSQSSSRRVSSFKDSSAKVKYCNYVHTYKICGEASAHIYGEEQSF